MPQTVNVPGVGQLTFPDGMSQPEMAAAIQKNFPQIHVAAQKPPQSTPVADPEHAGRDQKERILAAVEQAKNGNIFANSPGVGIIEGAANLATGVGSSIVGGFRGLSQLAMGNGLDAAVKASQDTQHAYTYQPRTGAGKIVSELAAVPLGIAKEMGHSVGGDIGQVVGGDQGRIAGSSIGEVLPDVAATVMGGRAAVPAAGRLAARVAENRSTPIPGRDYTPLRELTAEQSERMQRMTDQGIQPTLADVTRDPQTFRFEDQTGKTNEGALLRERELDTNDALIKAIEDTDTMRAGRGTTGNARETGSAVANALNENAETSLANVGKLYDEARNAGETNAVVDTAPLEKFLIEHKAESIAVPALNAISSKLEFLKDDRAGAITINDLENLYQSAGKLGNVDGSASSYMGQVKSIINDLTEGVGGDLYRQARKARLDHAMEFEDRGAIAGLIEKKKGSRTDYKTASEDVFNRTVVNSSLAELQDVTNSLLTTDQAVGRTAKPQAVRELQAETIRYLLNKATEKGVPNERGVNLISAPALRNAVNEIGQDKLNFLLGPEALARLNDTVKNAQEINQAAGKVSGSDTHLNLRDTAERAALMDAAKHLISKVPGLSSVGRYFERKAAESMMQENISDSLTPRRAPASEIRRQQQEALKQQDATVYHDIIDTAIRGAPAAYVSGESPAQSLLRQRVNANRQQKMLLLGQAKTVDQAIQAVSHPGN